MNVPKFENWQNKRERLDEMKPGGRPSALDYQRMQTQQQQDQKRELASNPELIKLAQQARRSVGDVLTFLNNNENYPPEFVQTWQDLFRSVSMPTDGLETGNMMYRRQPMR
ncbi:MAG: hypothetical protein ACW99G_01460 [Candidatus Thorarchaeota archaeon]|jgi:hypothetical protein